MTDTPNKPKTRFVDYNDKSGEQAARVAAAERGEPVEGMDAEWAWVNAPVYHNVENPPVPHWAHPKMTVQQLPDATDPECRWLWRLRHEEGFPPVHGMTPNALTGIGEAQWALYRLRDLLHSRLWRPDTETEAPEPPEDLSHTPIRGASEQGVVLHAQPLDSVFGTLEKAPDLGFYLTIEHGDPTNLFSNSYSATVYVNRRGDPCQQLTQEEVEAIFHDEAPSTRKVGEVEATPENMEGSPAYLLLATLVRWAIETEIHTSLPPREAQHSTQFRTFLTLTIAALDPKFAGWLAKGYPEWWKFHGRMVLDYGNAFLNAVAAAFEEQHPGTP